MVAVTPLMLCWDGPTLHLGRWGWPGGRAGFPTDQSAFQEQKPGLEVRFLACCNSTPVTGGGRELGTPVPLAPRTSACWWWLIPDGPGHGRSCLEGGLNLSVCGGPGEEGAGVLRTRSSSRGRWLQAAAGSPLPLSRPAASFSMRRPCSQLGCPRSSACCPQPGSEVICSADTVDRCGCARCRLGPGGSEGKEQNRRAPCLLPFSFQTCERHGEPSPHGRETAGSDESYDEGKRRTLGQE